MGISSSRQRQRQQSQNANVTYAHQPPGPFGPYAPPGVYARQGQQVRQEGRLRASGAPADLQHPGRVHARVSTLPEQLCVLVSSRAGAACAGSCGRCQSSIRRVPGTLRHQWAVPPVDVGAPSRPGTVWSAAVPWRRRLPAGAVAGALAGCSDAGVNVASRQQGCARACAVPGNLLQVAPLD